MFFGTIWEHHTWSYEYNTQIIGKLNHILCYSEEYAVPAFGEQEMLAKLFPGNAC